jgi:hypothetical protein
MFFKKSVWTLWLAAFALIGCSKGEPPANKINAKFGSTECFKEMGDRFHNFFAGTAQASDIHGNWTCMQQVLNDFSRLNETDRFQKDDLKDFLVKHYFKQGLTDDVVKTTLRLKQVLVGGDLDSVTKAEIASLIEDLGVLDQVTTALSPVAPILFGQDNAKTSEAEWNQSFQSLMSEMTKLANMFSREQAKYSFDEAQAFLLAWADQFDLPNDNLVRKVAQLMPMVQSAKALLVAGDKQSLQAAEWSPLLAQLASAYATYKGASRMMDRHPEDVSMALAEPQLLNVVQNLIQILDLSVQRRSNKQIQLDEIVSFLKQIESAGYFPKSFTSDQAALGVRFFVSKIFAVPSASQNALDAGHVAEMQKFWSRWRQIDQAYKTGQLNSVSEFAAAIQTHDVNLNLDESGRLELPATGPLRLQGEYPAMFTLIEWLGQKWGSWPLTEDRFHAVIADGLGLIHSLGWLSSTEDGIYLRLLREANLFMPSSNGNMLLESSEAFQYALFTLSSYRSSHRLQTLVDGKCGADDFRCVQDILFNNRSSLLSNLPDLSSWIGSTPGRFNEFANDLHVITGNTYLMEFMVMNYIETFLLRFDGNHDGNVNLIEAMSAFPVYGPVLTKMLAKYNVQPNEIEALYTFMFSYGATPFSMFGGSVRYLYWKLRPDSWSFSADRKTLASILAELAKL